MGQGDTFAQARERAYRRAGSIHFDNVYYRRDIGDLSAQSQEAAWTPNSPAPTG
ncbi:MAG: phosphoribosylglycinamide synthetase C domain-containing protein [Dehalococcoidia bacterium]